MAGVPRHVPRPGLNASRGVLSRAQRGGEGGMVCALAPMDKEIRFGIERAAKGGARQRLGSSCLARAPHHRDFERRTRTMAR